MDHTTRRRLLTQGGRAALAALALQGALGTVARAQQLVPGSPTLATATPEADAPDHDLVAQHLALFDRLDFESWNTRDWELFLQLHAEFFIEHLQAAHPASTRHPGDQDGSAHGL